MTVGKGGRRVWPVKHRKRFALRLYSVMCERLGADAPFERLKRELTRAKLKTRESTVRNWLPPLTRLAAAPDGTAVRDADWRALRAPDIASLAEVANLLDVSVDYLLGASVPPRLMDRQLRGNFAASLLTHVVRDYIGRATGQRRDGLAAALGAVLTEREPTPEHPGYTAALEAAKAKARSSGSAAAIPVRISMDWPKEGDVLPDGRIVTNRSAFGLQLLRADSKRLLQTVCDRVFLEAEQWEENHKENEREKVRDHIRILLPVAAEIATSLVEGTGTPTAEAEVLRRLLDASLDPLNSRNQLRVLEMSRGLQGHRDKEGHHAQMVTDIQSSFPDSELEQWLAQEFENVSHAEPFPQLEDEP